MTSRHATPPSSPAQARHAAGTSHGPTGRVAALTLVAVLAFGATAVAAAYANLQGNITALDVDDLLTERPTPATPTASPEPGDPALGEPLNILVLGSDDREGENGEIGGVVEGMRSDTTIVAHISADRSRVELVSIPRDSLVDIPECLMTDGTVTSPRNTKFNEAFAIGYDTGGDLTSAAACTIRTVESITGVAIDHFVVVDFTGFIKVVDALGGVPLCIPQDIDSPIMDFQISAGQHDLDGVTALNYARARIGAGLGDGSDTARIGRQQQLLAATAATVLSKNLLTDLPALYRFADAGTESLTMDPGLAPIPTLVGLANSLRDLDASGITFTTVPWRGAGDGANVVWTDEADALWAKIAADQPLVSEDPTTQTPGATTSPSPSTSGLVTVSPTDAGGVC